MWTKSSYSSESATCVEWHVSSRCDSNTCIEVYQDQVQVLLRDSKDRGGPVLTFTPDEWTAFINGVKAGEFDL